MFVVDTVGKLPDLLRVQIDDEDVQPAVVVEPRVTLRERRFVEITRDDHRVALYFRRFRARGCVDECDLLAVGRPCDVLAGVEESAAVRVEHRSKELEPGSVGA